MNVVWRLLDHDKVKYVNNYHNGDFENYQWILMVLIWVMLGFVMFKSVQFILGFDFLFIAIAIAIKSRIPI